MDASTLIFSLGKFLSSQIFPGTRDRARVNQKERERKEKSKTSAGAQRCVLPRGIQERACKSESIRLFKQWITFRSRNRHILQGARGRARANICQIDGSIFTFSPPARIHAEGRGKLKDCAASPVELAIPTSRFIDTTA